MTFASCGNARGGRALIGIALALGCAGDFVVMGLGDATTFRHRELGYQIAAPPRVTGPDGEPVAWERVEIRGTDLAFRDPTHQTLSFMSRCRRTSASAQVLSRSLLLGAGPYEVLSSHPQTLGKAEGWAQTVRATRDHTAIRIRTLTVKTAECVFDWMLVSSGDLEPADAAFDHWVESFRHAGLGRGDPET